MIPMLSYRILVRAPLQQVHGPRNQLTSFDSGSNETLACYGWTLLVCPPAARLSQQTNNNNNSVLISSWEFVTTLDYEWSVIRRHRPFRWTIWVRINSLQVQPLD
jgi:hypothetical protein